MTVPPEKGGREGGRGREREREREREKERERVDIMHRSTIEYSLTLGSYERCKVQTQRI